MGKRNYVLVDAGALKMALNVLDRDAKDGKLIRAEIAEEVRETVRPYEPNPSPVKGPVRWEWSLPPDWDETKFNLGH